MNPNQLKYFGWNFLSIQKFEFRCGSVSLTSDDTFMCVELAMSFVKAASIRRSPQQLRQYSQRTGSLKDFIQSRYRSFNLARDTWLNRLFDGKDPTSRSEACRQPVSRERGKATSTKKTWCRQPNARHPSISLAKRYRLILVSSTDRAMAFFVSFRSLFLILMFSNPHGQVLPPERNIFLLYHWILSSTNLAFESLMFWGVNGSSWVGGTIWW